MKRIATILLGVIAVVLLLLVAAVTIFTRTDFGRERARRITLGVLGNMVHGRVTIGRIEGNLANRFSLVDVTIEDPSGRTFLTADRVTARVATRSLISRRIAFTELSLVRPAVRFARDREGTWNFERIFPHDTVTATDTVSGFGSWVELRNVSVTDGRFVIDQPWTPDEGLPDLVRDSSMGATHDDNGGGWIERVPPGYQRSADLKAIYARVPRALIADPDSAAMTLEVASLRTVASLLAPPPLDIRDFRGDLRIDDETITARDMALQLPASRVRGSVAYRVAQREIQLGVVADTIAFDDLRGVYADLPERGGGRFELDAAIRDTAPDEYAIRNARLHADGSLVEGHATFIVGPRTSYLRDTDVQLTRFTTSLMERLAPGVESPVPGAFTGRVQANGPIERMQVAVEGDFDPTRHPPVHLIARGGVGFSDAMRADRLEIRAEHVPATLLSDFSPGFPLGGMFTLHTTLTGSTASTLSGPFNLTHADDGAISRFIGTGSIAPKNAMAMNLEFRMTPLSLELVQRFMPKPDLRGEITGTGRVRGTPDAMEAHLALLLPAGTLGIDGSFDKTKAVATYSAEVRIDSVDLKLVAPSLPRTNLNGVATLKGRGTTIPTMDARLTANLHDFVYDSTKFIEAIVLTDVRASRLEVDTVRVRTDFGVVRAAGSFGLTEGHDGTLTYRVDLTDLSGLQRWIAPTDTGLVQTRPLVRQRLGAMALRADSIRRQQSGDTVSIASLVARGDLKLRDKPVPMPEVPPVRRDSLAGSARITGDLRGNVKRFDARGTAATSGIVYDGSEVGRGTVAFTIEGAGAPSALFTVDAGLDSVRLSGFAFDSTHVKGRYRNREGEVELAIFPGDTAEYRVKANYVLHADHGEVHVRDLSLRFDSTTWVSDRPSTVRWRGRGLEIDSLQLHERIGAGRILVHGEIPDRDAGRLDIALDSVRLAPWLTLLQSNIPANAVANFHGRVEGTRLAPRFEGTLALISPTYRGVPYPEVHTRLTYDQRRLVVDGDLRRAIGTRLATIKGTLPIDLSLGDSVETRLLDGPLTLEVAGDSIPLAPLREVTDAFSVVDGYAKGAMGVRGTYKQPRLEGALDMRFVGLGLASTGVLFRNVASHVRATGETIVIDSLVAHSGGTIRVRGSVGMATLTEPILDLRVESKAARILSNEHGDLWADSRLTVKGPLDTLAIDGTVGITRGVIYLPDPDKLRLISTGDAAVLSVIDTAMARELDVLPGRNVLENLNANVDLHVARGTWARSREANVEVYGDVRVRRDPLTGLPALTGALFTDHGEYTLYGRDFVVTRGSARFTGDPSINPELQVMATYQVRQAGRAPFDIQVVVGGSLRQPTLALESEAQPTLSQSDLLSFLAFGQSGSSLLQFQGSALDAGGQAGSSMAGNVASLATMQLASVAMGALIEQAQSDLTQATRADVVRIRSSNLPTDLSLGGVATVLRGTELRIGKYVGPQTFVYGTIRGSGTIPGLSVERWYGSGSKLKLLATFETRFQALRPTLSIAGRPPETVRVLGALLRYTVGW